ncbi:MAG: aldolase/citrate lyase family protein [Treponema sp.]
MDKKNRIRRTMMFLNAQRPSLLQDAYIYKADSLMFDLEDAVAEREKDSARFSLYHALTTVDYQGCEKVVRINGLDTPHYREDIRVCVAAGADAIRIPKCEKREEVLHVAELVSAAEKEYNKPEGSTLLMAAVESPRGVINALEICEASPRMMGIALGAGDYIRNLHTTKSDSGIELLGARSQLVIAARAAGIQCFDTAYLDIDNIEGFKNEVALIKQMGFDGKSLISPKQIAPVHEIYTPSEKAIRHAEKIIIQLEENKKQGIGVFTIDGKMVDIALLEGAQRTISYAKASGVYKGAL